jgi:hypothetical protein
VRLSPARLALRVALLTAGGAWLLWRALLAWREERALDPAGALLASRVALVSALMGALALVMAAGGALSLLRRPPRKTLRLGDLPPGDGEPPDRQ